jgi:hypothetical protein
VKAKQVYVKALITAPKVSRRNNRRIAERICGTGGPQAVDMTLNSKEFEKNQS